MLMKAKYKKKINIRKIISMKEVIDKPINEIKIKIQKLDDIEKFNKLDLEGGKTKVLIDIEIDKKNISFQLNKYRKLITKCLIY